MRRYSHRKMEYLLRISTRTDVPNSANWPTDVVVETVFVWPIGAVLFLIRIHIVQYFKRPTTLFRAADLPTSASIAARGRSGGKFLSCSLCFRGHYIRSGRACFQTGFCDFRDERSDVGALVYGLYKTQLSYRVISSGMDRLTVFSAYLPT